MFITSDYISEKYKRNCTDKATYQCERKKQIYFLLPQYAPNMYSQVTPTHLTVVFLTPSPSPL